MTAHHEQVEIRKVSDLVARLEGDKDGHKYLFRGQPVDKPLFPSIARDVRDIDLKRTELSYLDEFRRRSAAFLDSSTREDDWRLLTIAQHNGAPTRLLDWSRNPLAALWFAVASGSEKEQAVVWQIRVEQKDYVSREERRGSPFELKRTKFLQPDHISPRVLAQESYFSVHRYWDANVAKGRRYVALEDQKEFKGKLTKYVIQKGVKATMFASLDRLGLNFANLMPDLDGLSRHLAIRYKLFIEDVSFSRMIAAISSQLNSEKNRK